MILSDLALCVPHQEENLKCIPEINNHRSFALLQWHAVCAPAVLSLHCNKEWIESKVWLYATLTFSSPSSFRLMMSRSKSVRRPVVMLNDSLPVKPSQWDWKIIYLQIYATLQILHQLYQYYLCVDLDKRIYRMTKGPVCRTWKHLAG